jgi:tetratricopeptide (TPR) repeat protein
VLCGLPAGIGAATSGVNLWKDPTFQKQFLGTYGTLSEVEPGVTEIEREAMDKVLALMGKPGGTDEARTYLLRSTKPANSAVFDFTLANIYFQQGKLKRAVDWYLKALEKFPSYQRAYKNLGLVYIQQGVFDKAVPVLTRAIELGASDGLTYGYLGYALLMAEQYVSAESAYRMATMLQPNTLDWKMGLARCFFRQGRFDAAAALCEELIRDDPESGDFWLLQANAYLGLEQPMKAAANYEYLDTVGFATVDSLNTLGDIYVNAGLMDQAADAYLRALAREDRGEVDRFLRDAEVLAARGAYQDADRLAQAVQETYRDALGEVEKKRLLKLEARMATARGDAGEDQARLLQQIVDLDPLDGEALILLAKYHIDAEEHEQGYFLYERAAGLEDFEAEATLRHGQALVRQARYQDALPLLKRAQEISQREDVAKYIEQVERVARSGK